MGKLETITVTLSVDEWDLLKQLLKEERDPKAWQPEIDYMLEEINAAEKAEAVI